MYSNNIIIKTVLFTDSIVKECYTGKIYRNRKEKNANVFFYFEEVTKIKTLREQKRRINKK